MNFASIFRWCDVFRKSFDVKKELYHSIVCSIEICLRSIKNVPIRSKMPSERKSLFPLIMNISCEKNLIYVVHGECRGIMVTITCQPRIAVWLRQKPSFRSGFRLHQTANPSGDCSIISRLTGHYPLTHSSVDCCTLWRHPWAYSGLE